MLTKYLLDWSLMKIAFKGSLPTYKSSGPLGPAQVLDYLNQWGGG